ncbi:MAG: ribonucleotide reductase N-terminal alpha domain-containing protein, partial [Bacteroidota bacterium]
MKSRTRFETEIAEFVWNSKYRYRPEKEPAEADITGSWRRVADALSETEPDARRKEKWKGEFYRILEEFKFLPAGRILAGAGTAHAVTLFNCFVMGRLAPSISEVFEGLREGAVTLQQGGGVGYDFSTLWPSGTIPKGSTHPAKGVVEYLKLWDAMSAAIHSTKRKSGAMMATLRCDHPDVDKFVKAKQETDLLTNFNLSVMITDEFMEALQRDRE